MDPSAFSWPALLCFWLVTLIFWPWPIWGRGHTYAMQANKTITLLNVCSAGREATRSQFVCPFLGVDHTREVKLWRTGSQDVEFALLRDANVFLLLLLAWTGSEWEENVDFAYVRTRPSSPCWDVTNSTNGGNQFKPRRRSGAESNRIQNIIPGCGWAACNIHFYIQQK